MVVLSLAFFMVAFALLAKSGCGLVKNLNWFRAFDCLKKFLRKKSEFLSYEKILYRTVVNLLLASKEKLAEPWRVGLAADNSYWCLGCGESW